MAAIPRPGDIFPIPPGTIPAMKPIVTLLAALLCALATAPGFAADLAKIASRDDLDAVIAATPDAAFKKALTDNAAAILSAAEQRPHIEAVVRAIESSPGTFRKSNSTPEPLKAAAGGDIALFDTLTLVNTGILGGRAHVYRKPEEDPYDAAFIEHLGHIPALESVTIVATRIEDSWLPPLFKLTNLKSLSIEGHGRLGDDSLAQLQQLAKLPALTALELVGFKASEAGLERLAGLKNLERFAFIGFPIPGHSLTKFEGWTRLTSLNLHSNSLDDEGMGYVCERFPNLEFIKLWHSQALTDASAGHLKKLTKLKGIEISCKQATAALLKDMKHVPLEYAALEYGVNAPAAEAIANITSISTLRRLQIEGDLLTDSDLALLAQATQLKELAFNGLDLPDARLPQLRAFSFLKSVTFRRYDKGYPPETQARIQALLPKVDVKVSTP